MVAVYVNLIHRGVFKLENVPASSREAVRRALELAGLNEDGTVKPLEETP